MVSKDTASTLFASVHRAGQVGRIWARLRGQPHQLLDLATVAATDALGDRHAAGIQTLPIAQIGGSEGRSNDFDRAFHPLLAHAQARWVRVAQAQLCGVALPPIELIQLGEDYFVRDGHHRISVAAALGQQDIDAVVVVWHMTRTTASNHSAEQALAPQRSLASLPRLAWRSGGDA